MCLSRFFRERKQFGDIFAETNVGGIREKRFERQFATAVDFAFRTFTAVTPRFEATDEGINNRPTRMIAAVDDLRAKELKLFVRNDVKRSCNDTANGWVVDPLVLATAELLDDKVNGINMFTVLFR